MCSGAMSVLSSMSVFRPAGAQCLHGPATLTSNVHEATPGVMPAVRAAQPPAPLPTVVVGPYMTHSSPSTGVATSALTLQGALPRELALKFERHKRDAEAHLAARKAAAAAAAMAPASDTGVGPVTVLTASECSAASSSPRPQTRHAHQRSPSRPRAPKGRSVILEDLDNRQLLELQRHPTEDARSSSPNPGGPPALAGKSDQRKRRPYDDCALPRGGGAPGQGGRQMFDKRTLRRRHRNAFTAAIQDWRSSRCAPGGRPRRALGCHVSVRVRPAFDSERQQGEFEVVSVWEDWGEVVVHNCLFHMDLVRMYVHHSGFCFPRVFGEAATNEDVFGECGLPLVAHALCGQLGTLFMFGQTGSGKTYTMSGIMERAAREIFAAISSRDSDDEVAAAVRLKTFEVAGRKCFDLLTRQRTELKLLDDQSGRTNIIGAVEVPVQSADECLQLLRDALGRRATAGHARNDESSRSHCVCILDLVSSGGSLILVDCAGTERRQDSELHSVERMRESAEINSSLHALKECIRCRGKEQRAASRTGGETTIHELDSPRQVHVPYRDSQLTRVLQESFTRPGGFLAAIGTISPTSWDTEHTLSTLKTLQLLLNESGNSDGPNFEQRCDIDPNSLLKGVIGRPGQMRSPGSPISAAKRDGTPLSKPRASSVGGGPRSGMVRSIGAPNPSAIAAVPSGSSTTDSSCSQPLPGWRNMNSDANAPGLRVAVWEPKASPSEDFAVANRAGVDICGNHRAASDGAIHTYKKAAGTTDHHPDASSSRKGDDEVVRLREKITHLEGELQLACEEKARVVRECEGLKMKNKTLESLFQAEQDMRKRSHNQLIEAKGQIRVFCRIRPPLLPFEHGDELVTMRKDAFSVEVARMHVSVDGIHRQEKKTFQFDTVFGPSARQDEVYREVEDLVQSAVDGYNVTLLAYGQTGSGKTYTMFGHQGEHRGIAPRTIESVFNVLRRLDTNRFRGTVKSHLVELYKADLVDLLAPGKSGKKLEVRRDSRSGDATVDNVEEREVDSPQQLLRLLDDGVEHRHVASTQMNADSSRSHLFLTISIEVLDTESMISTTGKIRLCDLAGSERPKKSGAAGDVMREAIEINKSLTALGDVIEALSKGGARGSVPYRNHKLTQLLSDSIGGNAKTLMFVNISPAKTEVEETINSLMYAARARNITNEVRGPRSYTPPHSGSSPSRTPWNSGPRSLGTVCATAYEDSSEDIAKARVSGLSSW